MKVCQLLLLAQRSVTLHRRQLPMACSACSPTTAKSNHVSSLSCTHVFSRPSNTSSLRFSLERQLERCSVNRRSPSLIWDLRFSPSIPHCVVGQSYRPSSTCSSCRKCRHLLLSACENKLVPKPSFSCHSIFLSLLSSRPSPTAKCPLQPIANNSGLKWLYKYRSFDFPMGSLVSLSSHCLDILTALIFSPPSGESIRQSLTPRQ